MRCPSCGNFTHFSFRDDLTKENVYQCRTVGVLVVKDGKTRGMTLDHSDHFFLHRPGGSIRVEPVRTGTAKDPVYVAMPLKVAAVA